MLVWPCDSSTDRGLPMIIDELGAVESELRVVLEDRRRAPLHRVCATGSPLDAGTSGEVWRQDTISNCTDTVTCMYYVGYK